MCHFSHFKSKWTWWLSWNLSNDGFSDIQLPWWLSCLILPRYGVADLATLAGDTHKFESRYLEPGQIKSRLLFFRIFFWLVEHCFFCVCLKRDGYVNVFLVEYSCHQDCSGADHVCAIRNTYETHICMPSQRFHRWQFVFVGGKRERHSQSR